MREKILIELSKIIDAMDKKMINELCKILDIENDYAEDYDTVERPKHYNVFEREVIYVIKDLLDNNDNYSGFESYCIGNSLKYIFRAGLKGDYYEDLEKARYYINKILEGIE